MYVFYVEAKAVVVGFLRKREVEPGQDFTQIAKYNTTIMALHCIHYLNGGELSESRLKCVLEGMESCV
jgi:hypothetical protein